MLVSLAVQLEICLQVGFIGTEFADEMCVQHCEYLALASPRSVDAQMVAQSFERVGREIVADAALIKMVGILIRGFRRRLHAVR